MKTVIRVLLVLLVLAGAAGGYWYYRTYMAAGTNTAASTSGYTQVVQVTQGSLDSSITVVGQLEALQSASLAFEKLSGTANLKTLAVQAGNTVAAGQELATIDSASYQQALDQAKSSLAAAQKTLADLQTPATALEIAQADLNIAKAQQTLEQAKQDLADLGAPDVETLQNAVQDAQDAIALLQLQAKLAEHDALAKSERDLQYNVAWYQRRIAELEVMVAHGKANVEEAKELDTDREKLTADQADLGRVQAERALATQSRAAEKAKDQLALKEAQDALAQAKAGDKLAVSKAQLAIHEAEVALQTAQQARTDLDTGADATEIATAQADVDKKQLAVSEAETALAGTKLTAPFDGTILETKASAGDQVTSGTTLLTLADLKGMQVVASIDETTIRQVSAGQSASITFDAFRGQTFTGKVLSVPLQGTLQGGVTVYDVPISLAGTDKVSLLVGMTANVKIQVGSVENALLVPTMALQKANGLYEVQVPNTTDAAGTPETVPVEVGLSDGTYTQVVKGLNAGDQVIVQISSSTSSNNFFGPGMMDAGGPPSNMPSGSSSSRSSGSSSR